MIGIDLATASLDDCFFVNFSQQIIMSNFSVRIATLSLTLLTLGGCAASYQAELAQMKPSVFHPIPQENLETLRKAAPVMALAIQVMQQDRNGLHTPVTLTLDKLPGTMNGHQPVNRLQAQANTSLGVALGGPIGGIFDFLGVAQTYQNNHPKPEHIRYGYMADLSQPTLEFFRTLTPEEQSTPLLQLHALYGEEVGLISAVREGVPKAQCPPEQKPCIELLAQYSATGPASRYPFFPQDRKQRRMGGGGLGYLDQNEKALIPTDVPVGDNGLIYYGVDGSTGIAFVFPGVLPGNAYYSVDKVNDLAKRDPAVSKWYAVFNTPTPGVPGTFTWTVMHEGQVVGTGDIVVSSARKHAAP